MTEFGAYVHIPFCTKRCDYCAFATWSDRFHLLDDLRQGREPVDQAGGGRGFAAGVFRVLRRRDPVTSQPGGTGRAAGPDPSPTGRRSDGRVQSGNRRRAQAARLSGVGVTRLSLGVQSMVPHVLASLGRSHDVAAIPRAVEAAAAAGFADAYSVDLILGAAGESVPDWEASLLAVLALDPPPSHVSAYGLTVEAGTPLSPAIRSSSGSRRPGRQVPAGGGSSSVATDWSGTRSPIGPPRCRVPPQPAVLGPRRISRVRLLGPFAPGSSRGARRWWNVRTPERYIALIEAGEAAESAGEDLDVATRRVEALQLAVRTCDGVPEGLCLDGLMTPSWSRSWSRDLLDVWFSPSVAACWPTRWPCASAPDRPIRRRALRGEASASSGRAGSHVADSHDHEGDEEPSPR